MWIGKNLLCKMKERPIEILPYILNAEVLQKEILWLHQIIDLRIKLYFQQPSDLVTIKALNPPTLIGNSVYEQIIRRFNFTTEERIVLLTALAPHICPQLLDVFYKK